MNQQIPYITQQPVPNQPPQGGSGGIMGVLLMGFIIWFAYKDLASK